MTMRLDAKAMRVTCDFCKRDIRVPTNAHKEAEELTQRKGWGVGRAQWKTRGQAGSLPIDICPDCKRGKFREEETT